MIMTALDRMKQEQHEEEVELLAGLAQAKLEALHAELNVLRRTVRLTEDESTRVVMAAFYSFATQIAVEEGSTREEHLGMIGEMFDDMLEEIAAEEGDAESDKGSTGGGPVATAAVG